MDNPVDSTVQDATSMLQRREISSREYTEACLERIGRRDASLQAWQSIHADQALAQARSADQRLSAKAVRALGPSHRLCGVPVGVKDVIAIGGCILTGGSRSLYDNVSPRDAEAVRRLRAAGMVIIGHTKTMEFADGSAPQTSANPWNPDLSPGGSSNGGGSAVGGGTVPVALGTDSGGSLRRPASACGLSTMMGTNGRVSNSGVLSTNPSAVHVGPLASSALDAGLILAAIAGCDPLDPGTYAAAASELALPAEPTSGTQPFKGRRIGVLPDMARKIAPAIAQLFEDLLVKLTTLGAEIITVAEPTLPQVRVNPSPEFVAFHRRLFHERGHLYTPHSRKRVAAALERAPSVSALEYYDAQCARSAYAQAWAALFEALELDMVVSPSQTEETPTRNQDPNDYGDIERFGDKEIRQLWNTAGFPVIGVQMGLSRESGMPVGAQFAGRPWSELRLLQLAIDFQQHTTHHVQRPSVGV